MKRSTTGLKLRKLTIAQLKKTALKCDGRPHSYSSDIKSCKDHPQSDLRDHPCEYTKKTFFINQVWFWRSFCLTY